MATPNSGPNAFSPTKRPFGVILAESYFVTYVALISFRLIVDVDFYSRMAPRLNLRFLTFFGGADDISEIIAGLLSVLAAIGLQRMRPWGRWFAIVLAGIRAATLIWFYGAVLIFRLWTLVPRHVWPYPMNAIELGFAIYIVWYLLQPKMRHTFRPHKPSSVRESDASP